MLTFTGSKAISKTQATGTEKPDAPPRDMRWKRNVPALQPSYFNAQPGLLKRRRSAPADVRRDAAFALVV
jgi:hypothetical protein